MTVLTKPSAIIKKPEIISDPLVEKNISDEEKIEIHLPEEWPKRSSRPVLCMSLTAMLLVLVGFTTGLMLYRHYLKTNAVRRYQGFCSIPIPNDIKELQNSELMESKYRVLPLRWSSEPDVQFISTAEEGPSDELVNALREELDIGDSVEKISVINNGHRVNFIHDFSDNTTGIVDDDRCFVMDLEPELVLAPELFVAGLEGGGQFDVSRVRSTLRAALPALRELTRAAGELAQRCFSRPIYRLYREDGVVIRKRSVDDPAHDYIQFSGKHVQEIKIDNLQELLALEKEHQA